MFFDPNTLSTDGTVWVWDVLGLLVIVCKGMLHRYYFVTLCVLCFTVLCYVSCDICYNVHKNHTTQVALGSHSFSEDGALWAYTLGSGGSDWRTLHFRHVGGDGESTELEETLEHVKFTSLAWTHDNKVCGFFWLYMCLYRCVWV